MQQLFCRITTCAQILAEIQHLLDEWNTIIVYSLPSNTNETVTVRNDRLSSLKMVVNSIYSLIPFHFNI